MKIRDVIDEVIRHIPDAPFPDSVDTVKCGDPEQEVSTIVCAFTASMDVLRKAVDVGANFIITHEPTFYQHWDDVEWLNQDAIYESKRRFIETHGLTIWRFHDYWHAHQPDGILTGMVNALEWTPYWQPPEPVVVIPEMNLHQTAEFFKHKLNLPTVRFVGHAEMTCRRIGLALGAIGGANQIRAFTEWNVDTVVCGETVEWQTCEYVRDATLIGAPKALIVLGHAASEDLGMKYCTEWLGQLIPGVDVKFVSATDPYQHVL